MEGDEHKEVMGCRWKINEGHCEDTGVYSEKSGRSLKDFEQRNGRIWLTCKQDHSGCCVW